MEGMDWPHAPIHRLADGGAYMVTAGTFHKQHFFRAVERLSFVQERFFAYCKEFGWLLQAWAFFSNHYHFVAHSETSENVGIMLGQLHSEIAREINRWDSAPGRKVWFQFWDTHLTYAKSYFARLNYVHTNAVHHGLVTNAANYPWCSASWFASKADQAFVRKVQSFRTDRVRVFDPFEPTLECSGLPPS
jgi:putative transposase